MSSIIANQSPLYVICNTSSHTTGELSNLNKYGQYTESIQEWMLDQEKKYLPNPNYYAPLHQPQINALHRQQLVKWLLGLQVHLRLLPETLFIAINIVDRYLSRKKTSERQF